MGTMQKSRPMNIMCVKGSLIYVVWSSTSFELGMMEQSWDPGDLVIYILSFWSDEATLTSIWDPGGILHEETQMGIFVKIRTYFTHD